MPTRIGRIRIGCSGWQYRHWRGAFYPADVPVARWLEFYATRFETVELNNSFYRLPTADAFAAWRRRVPRGFRFAVKASRYLTHQRRLNDPKEPIERLWSRAQRLEDRLGVMLYQLPPRWNRNPERLAAFLAALPRRRRHVVEFRDPSWYHAEIEALLAQHGVARCIHDMPGSRSPLEVIGPFVYLRLHGAGQRYGGRYPQRELARWAGRLAEWTATGLDAYVYFNNDVEAHAIRDAERLRDLVVAQSSTKNGSSP
jgi:uncharacterized protein YecE (DUF72 family)